jgi:FkbM family methyltransferase
MSVLANWIKEFGLPSQGVVHVGAHQAQEASDYSENFLEPVFWIEAIPSLALRAKEQLQDFPLQSVVEAALWSRSGMKMNFNVSSNDGGSSSFFDFHLHKASYPEVATTSVIELETKTLSEVLGNRMVENCSFGYLVLDVQGAELEVLQGGSEVLNHFIAIVAEVSLRELYKGAPLFADLTEWLNSNRFQLIACNVSSETGWGDALFVRVDQVASFGLSILKFNEISHWKKLTFPTFVRIILIKLGLNPKYFSKSFLFGRKQ